MQVIADLGGTPGKDCRGYCKFCYFRKVKPLTEALGCQHCPPNKVGCSRCLEGVQEAGKEFQQPFSVLNEVQMALMMNPVRDANLKVNISGGGDVSCYPHLEELIFNLYQWQLPIHLGYTSGKGIDDGNIASKFLSQGVDEVTYTIFAADAQLRKEWMLDPSPEESLKAAQLFAEGADLHAAAVIIPGVNDGEVLANTCEKLEEWGAKALMMMRFANSYDQGLILGNEPVVEGIVPHEILQFEELVKEVNKEYDLRVTGTPLGDPTIGAPFILSKPEYEEFLDILPPVTGEATILTSKIAAPFLKRIFDKIAPDNVNVIATKKDIACLMTKEDLVPLDLSDIKDAVILPGRAFIHQMDAERILGADGVNRLVGYGPDTLSVDGELSSGMSEEEVIEHELESFIDLIQAINFFGMKRI
ncbi:methyl coenzyme M reductase-arginine methyltransferase Mmp10 [uncultured Methanobrevibacter sp.]|uniref:methyl coenzyme M reductase-arginine methyltransferase Mmp10 n=1 Tax=uncultured Methanobrevibacter sp. TaxID=253161 RepID=UPI00260A48DC